MNAKTRRVALLGGGFGVIPNIILYDRDLSDFQRVVYSLVASETSKTGLCEVSDDDMAQRLGKAPKTVSRAISGLRRYLKTQVQNDGTRTIELKHVIVFPEVEKGASRSEASRGDSIDNSIYIYNSNIDSNNIDTIRDESVPGIGTNSSQPDNTQLPVSMGKSGMLRVIKMYSVLWLSTYNRLPGALEYGRLGKALKPLLQNFTEYQLALMLMQYFQWYGDSGDDDFIHQRLANQTFPLLWFPTYADPIAVKLSNDGVKLDDVLKVKAQVDAKLKELKVLV